VAPPVTFFSAWFFGGAVTELGFDVRNQILSVAANPSFVFETILWISLVIIVHIGILLFLSRKKHLNFVPWLLSDVTTLIVLATYLLDLQYTSALLLTTYYGALLLLLPPTAFIVACLHYTKTLSARVATYVAGGVTATIILVVSVGLSFTPNPADGSGSFSGPKLEAAQNALSHDSVVSSYEDSMIMPRRQIIAVTPGTHTCNNTLDEAGPSDPGYYDVTVRFIDLFGISITHKISRCQLNP
jgi:hypothetical protein